MPGLWPFTKMVNLSKFMKQWKPCCRYKCLGLERPYKSKCVTLVATQMQLNNPIFKNNKFADMYTRMTGETIWELSKTKIYFSWTPDSSPGWYLEATIQSIPWIKPCGDRSKHKPLTALTQQLFITNTKVETHSKILRKPILIYLLISKLSSTSELPHLMAPLLVEKMMVVPSTMAETLTPHGAHRHNPSVISSDPAAQLPGKENQKWAMAVIWVMEISSFQLKKNVVFKLWDWEKRGKFMKTK